MKRVHLRTSLYPASAVPPRIRRWLGLAIVGAPLVSSFADPAVSLIPDPPTTGASPAHRVDFAREVYPVLEARCFDCHGPEQQKAELRLDSRETTFRGGKSGPVVQPGSGEASLLFVRIAGCTART